MLHWGRTKSEETVDLRGVTIEGAYRTSDRVAYFHVGAHKTGTTSLQNLIRENAPQLYQQGIVSLARSFPGVHGFPEGLSYQREFVRRVRFGVREIESGKKLREIRKLRKLMHSITADAPRLLVSEEGLLGRRLGVEASLYPQASSYMQVLTKVFPHHRPVVLLYIREQAGFVESNYLHSVKTGDHRSFREFVDSLNFDEMYWTQVVESLVRVCGSENVIVRPFESIKAGFVPFAREFFETFCDSTRLELREIAANPGLSALGVQVSRYLAPRVGQERWRILRQPVQRILSNRYLPLVQLFEDSEREALRARFDADYREALSCGGRPRSNL